MSSIKLNNAVPIKAKVLWKEEREKTYIATNKGLYILNKKATFIWKLIGEVDETGIVELYKRKFRAATEKEIADFIEKLKTLGLVEI
jgi:hypothetical protein